MLNKRSNGALNNTLFSSLKMDLMTDKKTHPAMERIYRAMASRGLIAEERRQSALARLLNTSSQAVKNWVAGLKPIPNRLPAVFLRLHQARRVRAFLRQHGDKTKHCVDTLYKRRV